MALQSKLFRGDPRLEAAAQIDPQHVLLGDRGPYVGKIQTALNQLDGAGLEVDQIYGVATANAVLSYKKKRRIINTRYQTSPDNIVGIMTMESLDKEMAQKEKKDAQTGDLEITISGGKIVHGSPKPANHPAVRLAFSFSPGLLNVGKPTVPPAPIPPTRTTITSRWPPNSAGMVTVLNTKNFSAAVCRNLPDQSRADHPSVRRCAFISAFEKNRDLPSQHPNAEDGGTVPLTDDPQNLRLEAFRPGDATVTVSRPDMVKTLIVEVRAGPKAKTPGIKLTRFTEVVKPSKFFSVGHSEEGGGEGFDPANVFFGRPVTVRGGGRLINLAGEGETPEFEDYQVDLINSEGGKGGLDRGPTIRILVSSYQTNQQVTSPCEIIGVRLILE